jgi:Flp pilus assembly protein CpaB
MRLKPPVRPLGPSLPRVPLALALRRRPRVRAALAAAGALLLGLFVARTVAGAEQVRATWGRSREVAVAVHDLPVGRVVRDGDMTMRRLPVVAIPSGALSTAPTGRVLRSSVPEGAVVVEHAFGRSGAIGIAAQLPAGTRAVAIPRDPATVPPVEVGQRVDVVAVVAASSGRAPALVLAAGAPVVAVADDAVAVAIASEAVPRVAVALAEGAVSLAVVAADP